MCWKKTSGCIPQKESLSPPMCLFFRGAEFLGDGIGGGGAGGEPVASPGPTASQVPTVKAQWHARLGVPPDGQKAASHTRPKGKAAPAPTFLTRPVKASADEHKYNTSKELEDLVKLVTAAKRCDVGDIVWFGWNEQPGASQVKSPSPSFGSTGIAVSVEGAKKIKYALPTMQMWHWDVELLKKLQQGDMKASFVFSSHWQLRLSAERHLERSKGEEV